MDTRVTTIQHTTQSSSATVTVRTPTASVVNALTALLSIRRALALILLQLLLLLLASSRLNLSVMHLCR